MSMTKCVSVCALVTDDDGARVSVSSVDLQLHNLVQRPPLDADLWTLSDQRAQGSWKPLESSRH